MTVLLLQVVKIIIIMHDHTSWYMIIHHVTWSNIMIHDHTSWYMIIRHGTWSYIMIHDHTSRYTIIHLDTWTYLMLLKIDVGQSWFLAFLLSCFLAFLLPVGVDEYTVLTLMQKAGGGRIASEYNVLSLIQNAGGGRIATEYNVSFFLEFWIRFGTPYVS